jgi:hypothetical protein
MKKKLLALILALLVLFASARTVRAVEVVKTIRFDPPIGSVMVYDSYKGAVWVTPYRISGYGVGQVPIYSPTNTLLAISANDSSVLANITLSGSPTAIAYDSTLHEIYVTCENWVSVISDESNSVVATIDPNLTLGNTLSSWVYDSGKGEMFAISGRDAVVISCTSKQVVASIPLENYPVAQGLTYDSDKGEIYVSHWSLNEQKPENYISVILDSNNSVIATIPLGNSTTYVGSGAYDSATGEIYLPTHNRTANNREVLVISDKTHTIVESIPLPKPQTSTAAFDPFSVGPFSVAYDPVKRVIFASTTNGMYIISDTTKSVIETVPVWGYLIVYDSGQNAIISLLDQSIKFISDASLPDPPPTPTPTPTATPTPSLQNPVFLDLDWMQIAILVAMGIVAAAAGVAAFRFLSKRRGAEQTKQE